MLNSQKAKDAAMYGQARFMRFMHKFDAEWNKPQVEQYKETIKRLAEIYNTNVNKKEVK